MAAAVSRALTMAREGGTSKVPSREEVLGMCYDERYLRRRREADEESRAIWREFDRTTPISDPQAEEVDEPKLAQSEPTETAAER
jgi:hypothetical protein